MTLAVGSGLRNETVQLGWRGLDSYTSSQLVEIRYHPQSQRAMQTHILGCEMLVLRDLTCLVNM